MLTPLGVRIESSMTSTVASKVEVLQHVETLSLIEVSLEDKLKLAELLSDIIKKSVVNFGQGPENLTPMLKMALKILLTWINDETIEKHLKEGNLVVEWLSHWIQPSIEDDETTSVMKLLSKLTKDVTSSFQPRAVTNLVRICLGMIVKHNEHSERFIAAVKILIHICTSDSKCSIIARSERNFKNAWEKITTFILGIDNLFGDDNEENNPQKATIYTKYVQYRVPLLLVHLIYTLESGPNFQILRWGMLRGCGYADWCFNFCINNVDHTIASDGLHELLEFFQTIFNQVKLQFQLCSMKLDETLDDVGIPKAYAEEVKRLEGMIDNLSCSVMQALLKKLELKKYYCEYANGLIKLVNIACPSEFPVKGIFPICTAAYTIVSGLWKNNHARLPEIEKGELIAQVLETYVHIATVCQREKQRRNDVSAEKYEKQWKPLLTKMMEAIKLVPASQPSMERINIACCQLINVIESNGLFQSNQISHAGFQQQVIIDIIDHCLFHPSIKEGIINKHILCLFVEVLGYLRDSSTVAESDLFLLYSSKPNVPEIFALALSSGFDDVTFKALRIVSHIGFCQNTLHQIAVKIATCYKPVFTGFSFNNHLKISTQAVKGVQKLEERLETLMHSYHEPMMEDDSDMENNQPLAISEILSLYDVKDTIYQAEKNGLLQQITDLTIYTDKLKSVMDKQAVLLSRKINLDAAKERQIVVLSYHCDKAKKNLNALQKKFDSLSSCISYKDSHIELLEKSVKDYDNNMSIVKREAKALKETVAKQQASLSTVEKELSKKDQENKELLDRIASLEREVKKKEEERKHIEGLLTQKNEQFNGIRSLLQNANRML